MAYTSFVKTASDPTVFGIDGTGKATAFSSWEQLLQANNNQAPQIQTVASIPTGAADSTGKTYAPLPQLNASGQASYAQPNQAQDPITVFNMKLMEMLGQAQGANSGNPALAAQANKLQIGQTEASMAPADPNAAPLRPGDALNARENKSELYNPEVKALNERMKLNNETIQRFTDTIKAAKEWGEEYYKMVKPDDATIQAVQMQMRAGIKPSADILEKIGGKLTQADWDALAAAGGSGSSQPTSIKEYEFAKTQGFTGTYDQWLTKDANRNSSSGPGTTQTERLITEREGIIAKVKGLPRGENGFANPNDYLDQASYYINKNGTVADFLASAPPERYLSPTDAAYVRKTLSGSSGRST